MTNLWQEITLIQNHLIRVNIEIQVKVKYGSLDSDDSPVDNRSSIKTVSVTLWNMYIPTRKQHFISAAPWQNQQNVLCAQRRLRSTWASAQSDQSLRCPHEETMGPQLPIERTAKTLIRPSLPWVHIHLLVLSWGGSFAWSASYIYSQHGLPVWNVSQAGTDDYMHQEKYLQYAFRLYMILEYAYFYQTKSWVCFLGCTCLYTTSHF